MGFRQSGFPMHSGTGSHSSALKQIAKPHPSKDAAFDKLMKTKEWMPGPPKRPPSKPKTKAGKVIQKVGKHIKGGVKKVGEFLRDPKILGEVVHGERGYQRKAERIQARMAGKEKRKEQRHSRKLKRLGRDIKSFPL